MKFIPYDRESSAQVGNIIDDNIRRIVSVMIMVEVKATPGYQTLIFLLKAFSYFRRNCHIRAQTHKLDTILYR